MKKRLLIAVGILLVALAVFRVSRRLRQKAKSAGGRTLPVAVAPVRRQDLEDALELTGDIRGANEAKVYPRAPGKLLRKIKDVGDSVSRDEVIALVDRDEPALQFTPSEARAPLSGVLTRYLTDIGEAVLPATPIAEVASIGEVKVVVRIAERELPRVRAGLKTSFTVDAFPAEVSEGKISRIGQSLDNDTRTAEAEIRISNPGGRLKPGMFARVRLVLEVRAGALVVPRDAISRTVDGQPYVFTISASSQARRTEVREGLSTSGLTEILDGLQEGQQVATLGRQNLVDGAAVSVSSR